MLTFSEVSIPIVTRLRSPPCPCSFKLGQLLNFTLFLFPDCLPLLTIGIKDPCSHGDSFSPAGPRPLSDSCSLQCSHILIVSEGMHPTPHTGNQGLQVLQRLPLVATQCAVRVEPGIPAARLVPLGSDCPQAPRGPVIHVSLLFAYYCPLHCLLGLHSSLL